MRTWPNERTRRTYDDLGHGGGKEKALYREGMGLERRFI